MEISHNATSTPRLLLILVITTVIFSSILTTLHYQLILIHFSNVYIIISHFTVEGTKFLEFKQLVQNYNWLMSNLKPFLSNTTVLTPITLLHCFAHWWWNRNSSIFVNTVFLQLMTSFFSWIIARILLQHTTPLRHGSSSTERGKCTD